MKSLNEKSMPSTFCERKKMEDVNNPKNEQKDRLEASIDNNIVLHNNYYYYYY